VKMETRNGSTEMKKWSSFYYKQEIKGMGPTRGKPGGVITQKKKKPTNMGPLCSSQRERKGRGRLHVKERQIGWVPFQGAQRKERVS